MKRNSAKLLLEFSVGLGIATLITTYLISTTSGRVAAFIPIISEMPFNEPEATIFGTGLGNWKLTSIHYDKDAINGYIVPYHAHSDFIQLGAELGIFGFFLDV